MRKYDLVCFDVDGTLIDDIQFIWQVLHQHVGSDEAELKRLKNEFFSGKIDYETWARSDINLWKQQGARKADLLKALQGIRLMEGARETLDILRNHGVLLGIVSGSLDLALEHLLPDYNDYFARIFLNQILFHSDGAIRDIIATPYDIENKGKGLQRIANELDIPMQHCVFVGDNFNDISAARIAGLAISFNSKSQELDSICQVVIKEPDLRLLLPYVIQE